MTSRQPAGQRSAEEILQLVVFDLKTGERDRFQGALAGAVGILEAAEGYRRHEFGPCVEDGSRFALLVWWSTLEDHTLTFRNSADYSTWRAALQQFIDVEPAVTHFHVPRIDARRGHPDTSRIERGRPA